jgi:hypothetical protein
MHAAHKSIHESQCAANVGLITSLGKPMAALAVADVPRHAPRDTAGALSMASYAM